MRVCTMCSSDKPDTTLVQVSPATWNGFNNFAVICDECQGGTRYKQLLKQKKIIAPTPRPGQEPAAPADPAAAASD